jgi:hypothetical protein
MQSRFVWAVLTICLAISACRDTTEGIRTQFVGSYAFSATERRTIARVAGLATIEARKHLPALPVQLVLQVQSGTDVIPELGATAAAPGPELITWTVDPGHPDGVVKIAETHLRAALLHECHHLVRQRAVTGHTLMDDVVREGLATAFERDVGGVAPLWGQYTDDADKWVHEILALPPSAKRSDWLYQHPDGRRWIGIRAGTYLADRAMKTLNRTAAELVTTPTAEVLAAGGVTPASRGLLESSR